MDEGGGVGFGGGLSLLVVELHVCLTSVVVVTEVMVVVMGCSFEQVAETVVGSYEITVVVEGWADKQLGEIVVFSVTVVVEG